MKLMTAGVGVFWGWCLVDEMGSFAKHVQKWSEVQGTQEKTQKLVKKILIDVLELVGTTTGGLMWAHEVEWVCLSAAALSCANVLFYAAALILFKVYFGAIYRRSVEILGV